MFCPSCGQPAGENDRYCFHCGAALIQPPKKGRWWPPVLAMVLIFSIGLAVFCLFRPESKISTDPAAPWFSVRDGVLTFYEYSYPGDGILTVPAVIGGQTVTALSDGCFFDCDTLIAVHLPQTLTRIGSEAFSGCDRLRAVRLPETLTRLDSAAFCDCVSLEAVTIPGSLTRCGSNVFTGCESLSYIFYSGPLDAWKGLELRGIPSGTVLSCSDGLYTMNGG